MCLTSYANKYIYILLICYDGYPCICNIVYKISHYNSLYRIYSMYSVYIYMYNYSIMHLYIYNYIYTYGVCIHIRIIWIISLSPPSPNGHSQSAWHPGLHARWVGGWQRQNLAPCGLVDGWDISSSQRTDVGGFCTHVKIISYCIISYRIILY